MTDTIPIGYTVDWIRFQMTLTITISIIICVVISIIIVAGIPGSQQGPPSSSL